VYAVVRGLVVAAAFLTCVSAVGAQNAPGGKEAGLARLSVAEKADAASRFFRLAKTSEDKQLALRLLVEAADLGDAEAATELGLIFLDGAAGIAANPGLARKYLDTAIKAGSVDATFELGLALLRGDGLPKDIATGIKLMTR
jgi:TPR repeat protein